MYIYIYIYTIHIYIYINTYLTLPHVYSAHIPVQLKDGDRLVTTGRGPISYNII